MITVVRRFTAIDVILHRLSESHSPWKTVIPEICRNVNVAWSISRSISIENDSSVSMLFF